MNRKSHGRNHCKPGQYLLLIVAVISMVACGEPAQESFGPEMRIESVCADGASAYDVYVERRVTTVGPSSNALAAGDDALWIVESGANTVSRFDLQQRQMDHGFLHVGGDRNPYALDMDEERREIWVANYAASTITVADMEDGQILSEIEDEGLQNPSAIALTDDYAYVSDVNYRSISEGYGPGSIAVVDRGSRQVVSRWETAFKNPQFLSVEEIDGAPVLLVSGSGALDIGQGAVTVAGEGGLEWFDLGDDPLAPESQSFPLGQAQVENVGAPGRPLLSAEKDRLYFVSAIAPVLFVFDVARRQWLFDARAPLKLYESDGDATHYGALGDDGLLWISAFNEDAIYLFDTACDEVMAGPIDVGEVAHMLEGPQAIGLVEQAQGVEAYFLLSIANAMGRIRLEPTGE
jgi:hypothetical protein